MKLVNAGIKSKEEAVERLRNGEVFYYGGGKIHYMEFCIYDGDSPYRFGESPLRIYWNHFSYWEKAINWEDDVRNGKRVLCYVWSNEGQKGGIARIIKKVRDKPNLAKYLDTREVSWNCAAPVPIEDIWEYE